MKYCDLNSTFCLGELPVALSSTVITLPTVDRMTGIE